MNRGISGRTCGNYYPLSFENLNNSPGDKVTIVDVLELEIAKNNYGPEGLRDRFLAYAYKKEGINMGIDVKRIGMEPSVLPETIKMEATTTTTGGGGSDEGAQLAEIATNYKRKGGQGK